MKVISNLKIKENVQLAPLTTFKVGGAARFFVEADCEEEIVAACEWAKQKSVPLFILGGGSNVLISDNGFAGIVLQIKLKGIEINQNLVTAQAGEDWDEFVKFCVERDLAGIECLSGIPGFVGGTPVQNVGAYGQEVSETIVNVRVFDQKLTKFSDFRNTDCQFSYRKSIFNSTEANRYVVLSVTFKLSQNGQPKVIYKDLRNYFSDYHPTLREVREAVCRIRAEKGMLVRQGGADSQSAGSFFKNPIVSLADFQLVKIKAAKLNLPEVPSFSFDEENVKIPAAWLIEKSGFHRGFQKGKAGLSSKHTLALTNRGNASASEIVELKNEIQIKVAEIFQIQLQPEPIMIGFD